MDRKIIGRKIRQARLDRKWTQQALADAYGCSQQLISGLERGEISIEVAALERLAHVLGKDLYYFIPLDEFPLEDIAPEQRQRVQRLLNTLRKLPLEQQDKIIDAVMLLMEVQGVADRVGDETNQVRADKKTERS